MTRNVMAIIAVLIGVGIATYFADFGDRPPPQQAFTTEFADEMEANAAPDFTLTDLQGNERSLSEFRGKVVILNFWASWCAPCIKEFPYFLQAVEEYPEKLIFLGVSSDFNQQAMMRFLERMRTDFPDAMAQENFVILPDPEQRVTLDQYQTLRLPETILIDADGLMRDKIIGADWGYADLLARLEKAGFNP